MLQGECGDTMPSIISELGKNALYRQMIVEGSPNDKSTRFRMREIKIGFRKDKPTST
jgi:hypothetical protein